MSWQIHKHKQMGYIFAIFNVMLILIILPIIQDKCRTAKMFMLPTMVHLITFQ